MAPSRHLPSIQQNAAYRNAQKAAAELLGCDEAAYLFDMMIFKPAGHPEETPWHQDLGYFVRPFSPAGIQPLNFTVQFWIAVDDADVENGCMHFIPEAHEDPMREHYVCSGSPDDEGRLLAIRDPEAVLDLARAVPCPLPAGGATVHMEGTPHYTPPNTSADRGRRAYIVNFQDASRSPLPA
jgi:ectoine hydroxylase-related dioxygenase (phytanoyl-CoA dioxygenase family)